tara:strand:- start:401 stop:643 length:243 start_codon:yes stop_codon:yes gene_type:complete
MLKVNQLLQKLHKGAVIHDDSSSDMYSVTIEAPDGRTWGDSCVHCISWWAGGNKKEFWQEVMATIRELKTYECDYDWRTQ